MFTFARLYLFVYYIHNLLDQQFVVDHKSHNHIELGGDAITDQSVRRG